MDSIKNEVREAKGAGVLLWSWARKKHWRKMFRNMFRLKHVGRWIAFVAALTLGSLLLHYKDSILKWCFIESRIVRVTPGSWLIPIAILIPLSIPPLAGHELILISSGVLWPLGTAIGIVAAGTFLGEITCFGVFRWRMKEYSKKKEEESVSYACLARLQREAGVGIITISRYSFVPTHLLTAIQCAAGMKFSVFCCALVLSFPKQVLVVYTGYLFSTIFTSVTMARMPSATPEMVAESAKVLKQAGQKITLAMLGILFLSFIAMYIVFTRARRYYSDVLVDMEARKAAQIPLRFNSATQETLDTVIEVDLEQEHAEAADERSRFLHHDNESSVIDDWRPVEYKVRMDNTSFTHLPLASEEMREVPK